MSAAASSSSSTAHALEVETRALTARLDEALGELRHNVSSILEMVQEGQQQADGGIREVKVRQ